MCILKVRFNFLHVFCQCFFYYIWHFFQQHTFCAMMGKVTTQLTDRVWPPAPTAALPTHRGSGSYVLRVSCLFLHLFCSWFLLRLFLFYLNMHCSVMGVVKIQPTDWVWSPALITALPSLIRSNGYITRVSFHSLPLFCNVCETSNYFLLITLGSSVGWP
jgi:hypothetical protein